MNINKLMIIPDFWLVLKFLQDKEQTLTEIEKKYDITYCHLHHIKKLLISKGWVNIRGEDRRHYLSLTQSGIEVVNILNLYLDKLGILDEDLIKYRMKQKHKLKEENIIEVPKMEEKTEEIEENTNEIIVDEEIFEKENDELVEIEENKTNEIIVDEEEIKREGHFDDDDDDDADVDEDDDVDVEDIEEKEVGESR